MKDFFINIGEFSLSSPVSDGKAYLMYRKYPICVIQDEIVFKQHSKYLSLSVGSGRTVFFSYDSEENRFFISKSPSSVRLPKSALKMLAKLPQHRSLWTSQLKSQDDYLIRLQGTSIVASKTGNFVSCLDFATRQYSLFSSFIPITLNNYILDLSKLPFTGFWRMASPYTLTTTNDEGRVLVSLRDLMDADNTEKSKYLYENSLFYIFGDFEICDTHLFYKQHFLCDFAESVFFSIMQDSVILFSETQKEILRLPLNTPALSFANIDSASVDMAPATSLVVLDDVILVFPTQSQIFSLNYISDGKRLTKICAYPEAGAFVEELFSKGHSTYSVSDLKKLIFTKTDTTTQCQIFSPSLLHTMAPAHNFGLPLGNFWISVFPSQLPTKLISILPNL